MQRRAAPLGGAGRRTAGRVPRRALTATRRARIAGSSARGGDGGRGSRRERGRCCRRSRSGVRACPGPAPACGEVVGVGAAAAGPRRLGRRAGAAGPADRDRRCARPAGRVVSSVRRYVHQRREIVGRRVRRERSVDRRGRHARRCRGTNDLGLARYLGRGCGRIRVVARWHGTRSSCGARRRGPSGGQRRFLPRSGRRRIDSPASPAGGTRRRRFPGRPVARRPFSRPRSNWTRWRPAARRRACAVSRPTGGSASRPSTSHRVDPLARFAAATAFGDFTAAYLALGLGVDPSRPAWDTSR